MPHDEKPTLEGCQWTPGHSRGCQCPECRGRLDERRRVYEELMGLADTRDEKAREAVRWSAAQIRWPTQPRPAGERSR